MRREVAGTSEKNPLARQRPIPDNAMSLDAVVGGYDWAALVMIQHVVATVNRADAVIRADAAADRRWRHTSGNGVIVRLRKRKLPDVGVVGCWRTAQRWSACSLHVGRRHAGHRSIVFVGDRRRDVAVELISRYGGILLLYAFTTSVSRSHRTPSRHIPPT